MVMQETGLKYNDEFSNLQLHPTRKAGVIIWHYKQVVEEGIEYDNKRTFTGFNHGVGYH
jgi:hypothetical protein